MEYEIKLSYDELLAVDGKVNEKAQKIIDKAKLMHVHIGIGDELLSALIGNALLCGQFEVSHREINSCGHCDKKSSYHFYHSGRHKGEKNYDRKIYLYGYTFQDGFVIIKGYSPFGFCSECGAKVHAKVKQYILDNNLPIELCRDEDTKFIKERAKKCFQCGEKMWEYDMKLLPAIMGGYYHGGCPHCLAQSLPFGKSHDILPEFRMVEKATLKKRGTVYVREKV